jgi:uncharacterized membrane protein
MVGGAHQMYLAQNGRRSDRSRPQHPSSIDIAEPFRGAWGGWQAGITAGMTASPTTKGDGMTERSVSLLVAAYGDDSSAAAEDYQTIKGLGDAAVVAAVIMERDSAGKVEVKEHGGVLVAGGTAVGAVGGFVVGLFAPPLLLATVVGAGIGAGAGALARRHEEKEIGVNAEEWLPPGSSAIVAVVDDLYLDRVDSAVAKANKKISKAVDKGDYDAVVKAVNEGDEKIIDAAES